MPTVGCPANAISSAGVKIAMRRPVAVDRIDEDRLAEPELARDGETPVVGGIAPPSRKTPSGLPPRPSGPRKTRRTCSSVTVGPPVVASRRHRVRLGGQDRASATRWMRDDAHRIGDPAVERHRERLVERDPADRQRLASARARPSPWVRPVARYRTARSSVTEFERSTRASSCQSLGLDAGLLAQLALRADRAGPRRRGRRPRDLPRIGVERVAVLADEDDPVLVVDGDDARGQVREVDERRRSRGCRRAASTSSCQTVIHGFS